jgi:hypothetical protein
MKKYIIIGILVLAAGGLTYWSASVPAPVGLTPTPSQTAENTDENTDYIYVSLKVDGVINPIDNSITYNVRCLVEEGNACSVLDLMGHAQEDHGITFETEDFGKLGVLIASIAGRPSTDDMFWIYYVNDEAATVGVTNLILEDSDVVEWKFEESIY